MRSMMAKEDDDEEGEEDTLPALALLLPWASTCTVRVVVDDWSPGNPDVCSTEIPAAPPRPSRPSRPSRPLSPPSPRSCTVLVTNWLTKSAGAAEGDATPAGCQKKMESPSLAKLSLSVPQQHGKPKSLFPHGLKFAPPSGCRREEKRVQG